MKQRTSITILVLGIVALSAITTLTGILSKAGPGRFVYESIRGKPVEIYGEGIYQHMSADVAIQGIAQDYVTLVLGIPLLLISLMGFRRGSIRHHFLLTGVLGYFLVTYLFYTAMGMYNFLFLAYAALLGMSFFGLILAFFELDRSRVPACFSSGTPHRFVGGFLMFNALAIGGLWLSIVMPPLMDGTIYPDALEHYTTLIVQGFDLGLLLPVSFVVGWLLLRRVPAGLLFATPYIVFLALLMTALTAKVLAMWINGVNVIPVIFIIPTFNVITLICAGSMIATIRGSSAG